MCSKSWKDHVRAESVPDIGYAEKDTTFQTQPGNTLNRLFTAPQLFGSHP